MDNVEKSEEEWRKELPSESYEVLRNKATEAPFSGTYLNHHEQGVYRCKACNNILFTSAQKLDSSESDPGLQGWPSFSDPAVQDAIGTRPDDSHGMHRTEIFCKKCNGHLGHLFDEQVHGTARKHYCVNSVCLEFQKE